MSNPIPHEHPIDSGDGALRALCESVIESYGLDANDPRLAGSFALALEATRSRLAALGISGLDSEAQRLTTCRVLAPVFAAAHDTAIRAVLRETSGSARKAIVVEVDRVAQPASERALDWTWADPRHWRFAPASGRDAYEHGLLLASRAGCVVFFQDKGLKSHGIEPLQFAERIGELKREAQADVDLVTCALACAPAQWN